METELEQHPRPWRVIQNFIIKGQHTILDANGDVVIPEAGLETQVADFIVAKVNGQ